jgi:hypothetical protein
VRYTDSKKIKCLGEFQKVRGFYPRLAPRNHCAMLLLEARRHWNSGSHRILQATICETAPFALLSRSPIPRFYCSIRLNGWSCVWVLGRPPAIAFRVCYPNVPAKRTYLPREPVKLPVRSISKLRDLAKTSSHRDPPQQ